MAGKKNKTPTPPVEPEVKTEAPTPPVEPEVKTKATTPPIKPEVNAEATAPPVEPEVKAEAPTPAAQANAKSVRVICKGTLGRKLLKYGDVTDDPAYVALLNTKRGKTLVEEVK